MLGNIANLRIGSKLVLAFAVLIVAFGALLITSLQRFADLQATEAKLFQRSFERVSNVKELRVNIISQRAELLQAMSEGQGDKLRQREGEIAALSQANDRLFDKLLAGLGDDGVTRQLLDQLIGVRNAFVQTRDQQLLPLIRDGQVEQAEALALGIQLERMEQINDLGLRLAELTERNVRQALVQAEETVARQRLEQLLVGAVVLIFGMVMAWQLSRHIAQPLAHLTLMAERISHGEIPRELRSESRRDEVGRLALAFSQMSQYLLALAAKAEYLAQGHLSQDSQPVSDQDVLGTAFATMLSNLRNLVGELNEGITVLATSSEEILAGTSQVATSTQETATAISEIATTVEEVKQTAVMAGSKSQGVAESTERTRQVALSGRQAVEEALTGMQKIREQMQAVAESIMRLGEQSQAIGEIVASVGELAEQSNLLGVNASIEAAKAGEIGKGFSVVAQEVKALAEQSKQATAQVRGILGDIQKAMTKAVLLAEQGSKTVEVGYERARVSGEAIRSLSGSIEQSSEMALQIAATSQQQLIGMDQVVSAMENIRQASQDNVGGTRQVDLSARNLHQLGLQLKGLTARFKL